MQFILILCIHPHHLKCSKYLFLFLCVNINFKQTQIHFFEHTRILDNWITTLSHDIILSCLLKYYSCRFTLSLKFPKINLNQIQNMALLARKSVILFIHKKVREDFIF